MYLEALLLGVLVGFFRGGNLRNLSDRQISGSILVLLAFVIYLLPFGIRLMGAEFEYTQLPYISLCIVSLVLIMNFTYHGAKLALLGAALNIFIMTLNSFKMPVDMDKMTHIGFAPFVESINTGDVLNYTSITDGDLLSSFLGKVITLPEVYPFRTIMSAGDVVLSLGLLIFISELMQYPHTYSFRKKRGFFK